MLTLAVIALLAQEPSAEPPGEARERIDLVQLKRGAAANELEWSDAEDRLHGNLRPLEPVAETPLEISVMVGTFQGDAFDGPVTFTLRCPEWSETRTIRKGPGDRAWSATFVPPSGGECSVDVAFTTLRHKRLHFTVAVHEAPLSRLPWYFILAAIVLGALGLGIRAALKKPEPS